MDFVFKGLIKFLNLVIGRIGSAIGSGFNGSKGLDESSWVFGTGLGFLCGQAAFAAHLGNGVAKVGSFTCLGIQFRQFLGKYFNCF